MTTEPTEIASLAFPRQTIDWPDPTDEMIESNGFGPIWDCIKSWDINVPGAYSGYCGATGNHVRAILDALYYRGFKIVPIEMPKGPAGDHGQVGWTGGEFDRP